MSSLRGRSPNSGSTVWRTERYSSAVSDDAVRGKSGAIAEWLGRGTAELYRSVRQTVEPLLGDRPLSDDIRRLARLLTR